MENRQVVDMSNEDINHLKGRTVLKFWAPWCGPCKMLSPVFASMVSRFPDVSFGQINLDMHPEAGLRFAVRGLPTLVGLEDGKVAWTRAGMMSASDLESCLKTWA